MYTHSTIKVIWFYLVGFLKYRGSLKNVTLDIHGRRNRRTDDREEEYNGTFDDFQTPLQSPAGQATGADILVPAGGVPERVLPSPPDPKDQEKASGQRMALEASHDSACSPEGKTELLVVMKRETSCQLQCTLGLFLFGLIFWHYSGKIPHSAWRLSLCTAAKNEDTQHDKHKVLQDVFGQAGFVGVHAVFIARLRKARGKSRGAAPI